MRNLLLCSILLFVCFFAKAQTPGTIGKGKISGKITDATTQAPVEYATIALYKQGATSPINGTTSDPKGAFVIANLPAGEYRIAIDFLGYERFTKEHLVINATTVNLMLNNIVMLPNQRMLKNINVVGQASTVENKIDKLVYNVGNDLTAQGGVATDVLKKVPMVTVDIDGNVELLGNPSVKFLINGKPSSIFGASLADALQSIPSSQIKSVEVITSPGAKYDASGTGGIINIILKDNKLQGYNGSVNVSAGTRLQNASVNLNARKTNFGIGAYFSGNESLRSKTLNTRNRTSASGDTTQNQFQNGYGYAERSGYQTGINFDWSLTKKDNILAALSYHHFANKNEGLTSQEDQALKSTNLFSDVFSLRNSNSRFGENAMDVSVEYKKIFKKEGEELSIQYNSSFNRNIGNYYQKQDYSLNARPSTGSLGDNPGHDNQTELTADYTHPITEDFVVETGAKYTVNTINSASNVNTYNSTTNEFEYDRQQSNNFTYGRRVYSYYLSGSFKLFSFLDVKAGLRDEYTTTTVDFAGTNIPDYNFLSPSFVVQHKFGKKQGVKFAYSKRIERPDFGDINPFINYSDPYNIQYGNPNLHPEIGNNFEMGYNHSFNKGGNINITLYMRHNGFDVKPYTFILDSLLETGGKYYKNVYVSTRKNVGYELNAGLNISASLPVTNNFTIRPNIIATQRRVIVDLPNTPSFVLGYECRVNLNATYQFKHDLTAEAFVNYNTPRVGLQGKSSSFAAYNLAVRKQLFDKKFSVGLTATVPFNEYLKQTNSVVQTQPKYSTQYSVREVPFRSFGISLNYKFGKLEFKKEQEKDNNPVMPQPTDQ